MTLDASATSIAEPRASLRAWGICGLMLVATMLNYMDRQALAQQATEISRDLSLNNEDYGRVEAAFGLAFAVGGIVTGLIADRVSPRWLYPVVLSGWSAVGFATGWVTSVPRAARMSDSAGVLRVGAMAVCAGDCAAPALAP